MGGINSGPSQGPRSRTPKYFSSSATHSQGYLTLCACNNPHHNRPHNRPPLQTRPFVCLFSFLLRPRSPDVSWARAGYSSPSLSSLGKATGLCTLSGAGSGTSSAKVPVSLNATPHFFQPASTISILSTWNLNILIIVATATAPIGRSTSTYSPLNRRSPIWSRNGFRLSLLHSSNVVAASSEVQKSM